MIVDNIIKSLVEKHPDLLDSFEGGNWEDFLNGAYPENVEILVLRNIVEYARFNKYLSEEIVLLKKGETYTLGDESLDGEQGYEIPLLEGEEKTINEITHSRTNKSSTNNSKERNKLYFLFGFLILLFLVILGVFLALKGSTEEVVPRKDAQKISTKIEKKVENQNKVSEPKKEESKRNETNTSEAKEEEPKIESNSKVTSPQSRNNSEGRTNSASNPVSSPSRSQNAVPTENATEKPAEKPAEKPKEAATPEAPSTEEKSNEGAKETLKEEKKENIPKEEPAPSNIEEKKEDKKTTEEENNNKTELPKQ